MTRLVESAVFAIFMLMVTVIVAGCSSSLTATKEPQMNNGVTFNEIKVMVFKPPT